MKVLQFILLFGIFAFLMSCKETDDVPPIITLTGADSLNHILNEPYVDEGATALDETDGDVTSRIWVDNPVDENRTDWYTITYKAVDEAGNEATPVYRWVRVINQAYIYDGTYTVTENQLYPTPKTCEYNVFVDLDSTINFRLVFDFLVCQQAYNIYADVSDSVIVIPFQMISDSLLNFSLQASGIINESMIILDYKKTEDTLTSLWQAEFIRP